VTANSIIKLKVEDNARNFDLNFVFHY
jgi:hypothetical protein